ncbi:MAG: AraC family transcriptional regulator [Bacteroidota bacterium]
MKNSSTTYYKDIKALLEGLRTVSPISDTFHIHQFKDTPDTWIKETSIFRSNTYSLILLTKGKAKYKIGLAEYEIGDNTLYFMAPKHLRYYNRLADWEGFVIVFMEDFLVDHPVLQNRVHAFEGFKAASRVVVPLAEEDALATQRILQLLYDYAYSKSPLKFTKIKAVLDLVMIQSTVLYQQHYQNVEQVFSKQHRILRSFEQIIEDHLYDITQDKVDRILTISEIANTININPTYLGEVIKKQTGKSPKTILSERIILEAQSLLLNTDMAISEIAYFLKFQDASNFTKFFKMKTGFSPTQYLNMA